MAKKVQLYSLLYIISLKLVLSWELHDNPSEPQTPKKTVTDPVSSFISGIGDFILDVDKTIAETTEPKVNHENSFVAQILGPIQPRREYFDRIQQNYRTVQNRIGSLISDVISANRNNVHRDPVKIPSMNRHDAILGRSSDDIRTSSDGREIFKENQFLVPMTDASTHSHDAITGRSSVNFVSPRLHQHSQARQAVLEPEQIKRALEKVITDTQKTRELLLGSGQLTDGSLFARRNGDAKYPNSKSDNQGRIIGDVLYSESRFDQYIRQLIKDHGKWVLDNPLLQRWRGSRKVLDSNPAAEVSSPSAEVSLEEMSTGPEYSTEEIPTEEFEPEQITESENEGSLTEETLEKRSKPEPLPLMASNYYRIADDGSVVNEEIDIVFAPEEVVEDEVVLATESNQEIGEVEDEMIEDYYADEEEEPRDTILLAFTSDGIPLKLRMGPEIINPVNYLHKVLQSAGVTLKVPVKSHEDLKPVGKDVLLLGSEYGAITRAVYLDLSNTNELKSLLRTLMKSKVNEKMTYS